MNSEKYCDGCDRLYPLDELSVCPSCGERLCPECWGMGEKCDYCGEVVCDLCIETVTAGDEYFSVCFACKEGVS